MTYSHANTYDIPTGRLTLHSNGDPSDLLDVQARNNPKRGFLFVSKVLGKHLPVPLARMNETYTALVNKLPKMQGDVLVIGMAETATQLGFGVWSVLEPSVEGECFFLQTTRYRTNDDALGFEESHSHAPSQWIQGLTNPVLLGVRHVVLVDDELSTGKTFHALEDVLRRALPHVNEFHWVCLTDFRPAEFQTHSAVSLLQGSWEFEWTGTALNAVAVGKTVEKDTVPFDFGRSVPLSRERRRMMVENGVTNLMAELEWRGVGKNVLVLGSGEFMPFAYEMATHLQERGHHIQFQASTRSPALMPRVDLGMDHYGEGVPQYLYNYNREQYDSVVMFVEGGTEKIMELPSLLQAHVINVKQW